MPTVGAAAKNPFYIYILNLLSYDPWSLACIFFGEPPNIFTNSVVLNWFGHETHIFMISMIMERWPRFLGFWTKQIYLIKNG